MNLDEKVRIFLTDQAKGRSSGKVHDISRQVMITVAEFYKKPCEADGFRENYGMTNIHTAGWDSGGFQYLMLKLKGMPMEVLHPELPPVPINAQKTIDIYKRVGAQPHDLPIQLDLPPRHDIAPALRKMLIERSVIYYYEMLQEIPGVVPTIHGWTLKEIEYNLELVEDPDKLASGSMVPLANTTWTMGNMNPHDGRVAAGSFVAPEKSAVDYVHPRRKKEIAIGSYKPLGGSVNYVEHTDNIANANRKDLRRKRVASPAPGALDIRGGQAFVDKVHSNKRKRVATPSPGKVDAGISLPGSMPSRKKLAVGSFQALQTGPLGEKMRKRAVGSYIATAVRNKKRVSYKVIIDRIAMVMNRLREEYDVFMLGGASPHMQHQIFLSGAKWTDTSAWRIKAMLGEIYLPDHSSGHSSFGIGYSQKAKRMDQEAVTILKECLDDPRHPFSGMYWKEFMRVGHLLMPRFKREVLKRNYPATPFILRGRHNAFMLKLEEDTANEYVNDPDRYYRYIKRRLKPRKILSNRLTALWDRLQRPYVQQDLRVYAKERAK